MIGILINLWIIFLFAVIDIILLMSCLAIKSVLTGSPHKVTGVTTDPLQKLLMTWFQSCYGYIYAYSHMTTFWLLGDQLTFTADCSIP